MRINAIRQILKKGAKRQSKTRLPLRPFFNKSIARDEISIKTDIENDDVKVSA